MDANLGSPRVCVAACKTTVAPVAVAVAEPRSSSPSGSSRAATHFVLLDFRNLGFGTWALELGFWNLLLSIGFGFWTSHPALELGFLILFWHVVRPACVAICCDIVLQAYCQSMAVVNMGQAMKKLEKDSSTEATRTASSQHKVHCIPANVSSEQCRGSLNLRS